VIDSRLRSDTVADMAATIAFYYFFPALLLLAVHQHQRRIKRFPDPIIYITGIFLVCLFLSVVVWAVLRCLPCSR
jgi:predicted permease